MQSHDKLYVVVRSDLTPGQQAVQAAHAALTFYRNHTSLAQDWYDSSQYLVVLEVPDEHALERYKHAASSSGVLVVTQREPDFEDSVTAIALGPGPAASRLVAMLPLALREDVMA